MLSGVSLLNLSSRAAKSITESGVMSEKVVPSNSHLRATIWVDFSNPFTSGGSAKIVFVQKQLSEALRAGEALPVGSTGLDLNLSTLLSLYVMEESGSAYSAECAASPPEQVCGQVWSSVTVGSRGFIPPFISRDSSLVVVGFYCSLLCLLTLYYLEKWVLEGRV